MASSDKPAADPAPEEAQHSRPAATTPVTAPSLAAGDQKMVTVTLAHHLSGEKLEALAPGSKPLAPGDTLKVPQAVAKDLGAAGYLLGVESFDQAAIDKATSGT